MTDDIRALTARLADEPGSLAFLELAEALRRRGQTDAAYKVARGGLARYPGLADAHDLLARVLSDQGELAGAFDAWSSALQLDPMRTSALKGIAFLYFRAGDKAAALEHLQRALEVDPDDLSIRQAVVRIGSEARPHPPATAPSGDPPPPAPVARGLEAEPVSPRTSPIFGGLEGGDGGLLLVDANGLRLGGRLETPEGHDAGDRVAAQLAGVSREAARATRLLGLGSWHAIAIESPDGHLVLAQPTPETVLLAAREPSLPMGGVTLLAERAARAARLWLETS
ncbi:MAG TPA: tetratricopeptide repeat protein [Gemmatimonadales bacterium]|nr:tetratricopeptide repeat protein [Gemmatimonadales bacterium]